MACRMHILEASCQTPYIGLVCAPYAEMFVV